MALSYYCDKNIQPSEEEVNFLLGNVAAIWTGIAEYIQTFGSIKEEWKIYSKKAGWCKKIWLINGKSERNILFLYPNADYVTAIFVYGEKAVKEAEDSDLPKDIIANIMQAKTYQEGRSFTITMKGTEDLETAKELILIKVKN